MPIATFPLAVRRLRPQRRPLRRAQPPRERAAADLWHSDQLIFGTFFTGGLRAFDMTDPYQPTRWRLRAAGADARPCGSIQINDVFVDERGMVYTVDRHIGGLYILEINF